MAKRFTDTEKWRRPWFRKLSLEHKSLWIYMLDSCDHAGIWYKDFELASFLIGAEISESEVLSVFSKQIKVLDDAHWFFPDFIVFQYGRLRNNNSAHIGVLRILNMYGLSGDIANDGRKLIPSGKLSKKLKVEIYSECGGRCIYCNTIVGDEYHIDHITPRVKMGKSESWNLVLACIPCNTKKSDFDIPEFIKRSGLESDPILARLKSLKKGLFSPHVGAKDKDKNKDKDKDKDQSKVQGFDEFWKMYPRKKDKGHARDAWKKIAADKHPKIMAAIKAQQQSMLELINKGDDKFVKHPATWLNKECWDDDFGNIAPSELSAKSRPSPKCIACGIKPPVPFTVVCAGCSWCVICDDAGRESKKDPKDLVPNKKGRGAICKPCAKK